MLLHFYTEQGERKLKRKHKERKSFDLCACAYVCVKLVFTVK